jgi:predicted DNA-binding transcriptional regulator YafY
MLVDGVQSAKFITKEEARKITDKIKRLAGKDTVATLNRQTYVADRVRSQNDNVVSEADRIHQAIAEDSQVAFRYFHYSPDRSKPKHYSYDGKKVVVSPYALLWNNGNYYLYAYDGKKFRYYRVDRMEGIGKPLIQKREGKELFKEKDITHQKAKVFDMYGGKEYDVQIRFRNELADAVIDQFGKHIFMIPVDEDHFTITAPIEVSPTFFAWISTFGRRVKILGPEPVVKKMREFIQASADMYQDE